MVPTYGASGVNIADSSKQNQPEAHRIGFNSGSTLKEKALELCEKRSGQIPCPRINVNYV